MCVRWSALRSTSSKKAPYTFFLFRFFLGFLLFYTLKIARISLCVRVHALAALIYLLGIHGLCIGTNTTVNDYSLLNITQLSIAVFTVRHNIATIHIYYSFDFWWFQIKCRWNCHTNVYTPFSHMVHRRLVAVSWMSCSVVEKCVKISSRLSYDYDRACVFILWMSFIFVSFVLYFANWNEMSNNYVAHSYWITEQVLPLTVF